MWNDQSEDIYIIGRAIQKLPRSRLPTNRQVLSLYHNKRGLYPSLTVRKVATLVIDEVYIRWDEAKLSVRYMKSSIDKFIKLHDEWRYLAKTRSQKKHSKKEEKFRAELDKLFDVRRQDVQILPEKLKELIEPLDESDNDLGETLSVCTLSIEEPQLGGSQSSGTSDCLGFDNAAQLLGQKQIAVLQELATATTETQSSQALYLASSSSSSQTVERTDSNFSDEVPIYHQPKKPKLDIVTKNVALALDRTRTSSRSTAHILAAAAISLGHNLDDVILSHSTIHRARARVRKQMAGQLKRDLQLATNVVLHWDGKLLPDQDGRKKVERLPIVVSGVNSEQLLGVPKLDNGTAKTAADSIVETVFEWNLQRHIKAICFDTTPVNTGILGGVCTLVEKGLNKELLNLACRHHIFELVLRAVVEVHWPTTSGPDVPIFKRFQQSWETIDKEKFEVGSDDELISQVLVNQKDEILLFISNRFEESQPRGDYREFLELAYIFLGGTPPKGIKFKTPGAVHHARWLAKAIYCLKMFLFKKQFKFKTRELDGLRDICLFIVLFYVKSWFNAPSAIKAPHHDLKLMQDLIKFREINTKISDAAIRKFSGHLWYLSEYCAPLSIFDDTVPIDIKLKMVHAIKEREGSEKVLKRIEIKQKDWAALLAKDVSDFITTKSLFLFDQFDLNRDFLEVSPELWKTHKSFNDCMEVIKDLKVVNDIAERGVALAEEFNLLLTKDEDQEQYLLQVVKHHRTKFPDCTKGKLTCVLSEEI